MNVLITGAGLIGTHLARRLVDSGDQVVLYDLVPNRDYIGKVVGPDKAHVVAADMRDLPLDIIKGEPFTIDAKVYAPNEYVYAKDVALALHLACKASSPKQRTYNAGSGVVTSPDALAQIVKELAPKTEVQIVGASGTDGKQAPLDLSTSKAELGYTPQFPLKEALQDYMEALWSEGKIVA